MQQYINLVKEVLRNGEPRTARRAGVRTLALFSPPDLKFEQVSTQFPAITIKALAFQQVAKELYCFLQGYEMLEQFNRAGCHIWDANARQVDWVKNYDPAGVLNESVGRIYGVQWRGWRRHDRIEGMYEIDQLAGVIKQARENPHSRRMLVSAWNVAEMDEMCLPPCHAFFQIYLRSPAFLDLKFYMRSLDLMLGAPFDIASYALLMHILARDVGCVPGTLTMAMGDVHIYDNHIEGAMEMVKRAPRLGPQLILHPKCMGVDSFEPEHAELRGYSHHPAMKFTLNT